MTAAIDYQTDVLGQYGRARENLSAPTKKFRATYSTNATFSIQPGPTVVPFPAAASSSAEVSDNWVSRINQIKEEMRGLGLRAPNLGFEADAMQAINRVDLLVGALAGSRRPIFEVDPTDGEVAILWSNAEKKRSISINIDASDLVRIVAYFDGLDIQPAVKRISVKSAVDAVEVQEALADPMFSELIGD